MGPKNIFPFKIFSIQKIFLLAEGPLGPPYGGASPSASLGSRRRWFFFKTTPPHSRRQIPEQPPPP